MGYDMHIKGDLPEPNQSEVQAAEAAHDEEVKKHQARMNKLRAEDKFTFAANKESAAEADRLHHELMKLKHAGYFRLNVWGMVQYLEVMLEVGMAHESEAPDVVWPEYPEDDSNEALMGAYREAHDLATSPHGESDDPSIPAHKFSSNDGWLVTPDEINAALEAWKNRDETVLGESTKKTIATDYWGEWIAYLELAATVGGFRVY